MTVWPWVLGVLVLIGGAALTLGRKCERGDVVEHQRYRSDWQALKDVFRSSVGSGFESLVARHSLSLTSEALRRRPVRDWAPVALRDAQHQVRVHSTKASTVAQGRGQEAAEILAPSQRARAEEGELPRRADEVAAGRVGRQAGRNTTEVADASAHRAAPSARPA